MRVPFSQWKTLKLYDASIGIALYLSLRGVSFRKWRAAQWQRRISHLPVVDLNFRSSARRRQRSLTVVSPLCTAEQMYPLFQRIFPAAQDFIHSPYGELFGAVLSSLIHRLWRRGCSCGKEPGYRNSVVNDIFETIEKCINVKGNTHYTSRAHLR